MERSAEFMTTMLRIDMMTHKITLAQMSIGRRDLLDFNVITPV